MARLAERLSQLFGRVEILARGADEPRRAGAEAFRRGRVLEARSHALAVLRRVPGSPWALALWADAAEVAGLDDEVTTALSQLAEQIPWQQEIWLRLGLAQHRAKRGDPREPLERAAAMAGTGRAEHTRRALLTLCDLHRAAGEPRRALRWLDGLPSAEGGPDKSVALRRAECLLDLDDVEEAQRLVSVIGTPARADGRDRLVLARVAALAQKPAEGARALQLGLGAYILDAEGADALLAQLVGELGSSQEPAVAEAVRRIETIVEARGEHRQGRWRAALARAAGRHEQARALLLPLLADGGRDAAVTLLSLAVEARDIEALQAVAQRDPQWLSAGQEQLLTGAQLFRQGRGREALAHFEAAAATAVQGWASELIDEVVASWLPSPDAAQLVDWPSVLAELRDAARRLDRLDHCAAVEALAAEGQRPPRVALVGEFNAGKSTLLNALLGTDVAPTGVQPTTASLHWVAWAPDRFARIVVRSRSDRVVTHSELKATLAELTARGLEVERVYIYAPIERLKHMELLDTPGTNAPDSAHEAASEQGVAEAHLAIWLMDATAPLKHTERRALERIVEAGVPVQVLVNKLDRLSPEATTEVMRYVADSLAEVGIESYRPALALSARLALQGRLGDEDALVRSGWEAVERLVADEIVGRCDELRQAAMRRRAAAVAVDLAEAATGRAAQLEQELAAAKRRAEGFRRAAARIGAERGTVVAHLMEAMGPARAELEADARPVEPVARERPRLGTELREYLADRTVLRLGPPLAQGIAQAAAELLSEPPGVDADEVARIIEDPVSHTVMGAAWANRGGLVLSREALRDTIHAAVSAAMAAVQRTAAAAPVPEGPTTMGWRLRALARSLPPATPGREAAGKRCDRGGGQG